MSDELLKMPVDKEWDKLAKKIIDKLGLTWADWCWLIDELHPYYEAKVKQHYHPSIEAQKLQVELAKKQERGRIMKLVLDEFLCSVLKGEFKWSNGKYGELYKRGFQDRIRQALKSS